MLVPRTREQIPALTKACADERAFRSGILTALRTYGPEDARAIFWVLIKDDSPAASI